MRYAITWDDPNSHLFDIRIDFETRRRETELRLPAWRPGRYLIQNYAANVRDWRAESADGSPLRIEKRDKSTWVVTAPARQQVSVFYRFFAGILDAGSSFLDVEEAYFNGTNLFMMVADRRDMPVELRMKVPRGWDVRTQLRRLGTNRFSARDYDYLIDSPTIISPAIVEESFDHEGCRVSLVFQPGDEIDITPFVEPAREIVRVQTELFGELPTRRYAFLYHVASLWHGVEHEDSCSITLKRSEIVGSQPGDKAFDHFLGITAHEFFHLWNVKRLLPRQFAPYDYSSEAYTRLLWLMEGVTSYYAEKTLLRSRLWTLERYLEHLTDQITKLEETAAQRVISVAQASFDAWLQDPSQMHDKSNVFISFYTKGEVVGALLDLEIIAATKGRRSLDDVMRLLWKRFGRRGRGITEEDVVNAATEIGGEIIAGFFERFIEGREELPYEETFARIGVKTRSDGQKSRWVGAKFRRGGNGVEVEQAVTGSPAALAGLLPGDEIVAVERIRLRQPDEVEKIIARAEGPVNVLVARNDLLTSRVLFPEPDPLLKVALSQSDAPTSEELRLRTVWIEGTRR